MIEYQTIEELEEHIQFVRQKIQQIAKDVIAVFREDFPQFIEREVRQIFLSDGDFARSLDDDKLKQLKDRIKVLGESAAQTVLAKLEDQALWFAGGIPDDDPKDLSANTRLWAIVDEIGQPVRELLKQFGYSGSAEIGYKSPRRFVSGKYLPSLAEAYWRWIGELKEAQSRVDTIRAEDESKALLERWNSF
ncbi:MAG: hypothetical protein KC609_10920 [Myxococcales bacterium]|nr:hypothetical protein [Myxococcales bacterium]